MVRFGSIIAPLRAYFANLAAPLPFPTKLRLWLRNGLRRVTRLQVCCGHPGEPGC